MISSLPPSLRRSLALECGRDGQFISTVIHPGAAKGSIGEVLSHEKVTDDERDRYEFLASRERFEPATLFVEPGQPAVTLRFRDHAVNVGIHHAGAVPVRI